LPGSASAHSDSYALSASQTPHIARLITQGKYPADFSMVAPFSSNAGAIDLERWI
jgi:hypothetical protein